ncbi:AraC family transcriptional regulator [Pseudovibrio brasiliensis]|uniref:AraC family transcriptional regulator n=1 Tax=Pseudovibrio brasiliensis TaxID=1898042 RepID=A0ABX8AXX3_9HYPH|nr:helix-turn-helix domain-containing protein [Pseudovibrio brasiliensis]QUS59042.1 AraC family transcriptional regulator [Pseudovibrio brasiliensis]
MIGLYRRSDPPPALKRYIQAFYIADEQDVSMDIVSPPTGYPLLGIIWRGFCGAEVDDQLISFEAKKLRHFSGQLFRKRAVVHWQHGVGHAVAEFRATGFYELFGLSGELLINQTREVYNVHPEFDTCLAAKINSNSSPEGYLSALQNALIQQAAKICKAPAYLHKGIKMIEKANGAIRLSEVIDSCNVPARTFHSAFKEVVGLPPKYFCRVIQFNYVGQLIVSNGYDQLAGIAAEAGFFDQAHFSRAFQEFAAQSPYAFFEGDEVNLSTFIRLVDAT